MAMLKGHEVDEVDGPPNSLVGDDADDGLDLTDRCWWSEVDDCWLTDFPPPAGFDGYESRDYDEIDDDEPYVRACTAEEVAILKADRARALGAERAYDEDLRDRWFDLLREESGHPGLDPGSAFTSAEAE